MACWVEELPLARSLNSVSCDNSLTADTLDSCIVICAVSIALAQASKQ